MRKRKKKMKVEKIVTEGKKKEKIKKGKEKKKGFTIKGFCGMMSRRSLKEDLM